MVQTKKGYTGINPGGCEKEMKKTKQNLEESPLPEVGKHGCLCDSCMADCIRHNANGGKILCKFSEMVR